MGTMNINVYGRDYAIACDDGQEAHLGKLAQMVNERVRQLLQQMGRGPEHTMLIYTALMLADELLDARCAAEGKPSPSDEHRLQDMEAAMASTMQQIAARIDKFAVKLEQAA